MAETLPTQLPQDGGEEGQAASINPLPDEASAQTQTLVLLADACQQPSVNNASHLSPQSVVSANSSNKLVLPVHSDGASTSESPPHNSSPAAASQPDPSLGKASISLKKSSDTDTSQIKDTSDNRTENGSVGKEVSTDKKAIEVPISNPKEMASLITDCIERHQTLNSPLSGDSSVSAYALVKENPLVCVPVKQKSPIPSENPPNVTGSPSAKPLISSILSEKASNAVTVPKENTSHPSKSPLDELSVQSSLEMKKSVNNSAGDVKVTASAGLNNAEEKESSHSSLMPRATDPLSCDSKKLASSRPQEQLSALPPVSSTPVVSSGSSSTSLPPVSLCSSSLQNTSMLSPHMSSKSPESMDSSAFPGSSEILLKTASNTSALMEGVQSTSTTAVQESHASSSTSSVPIILEKPKEDGSLTSISDGQVEKNGKNGYERTDSTNSSETVHKSGESEGCENKSNNKTEKELLPSANSLSNRDSQGVCSGIDMTNDNASGDCWNESSLTSASTEAFPLIDSCSLPKNPTSCSLKEMEPKSSSPQVLKKVAVGASSGDSEPLQPVTIGGSLQPLEEVQEASLLDDPSYSTDLALLDSSADEADSIGGLVINSVIGAADGVAAFHPDDEKETDRELTDISTSAPQIVEESCDIDSSEETGPSPKKMRLENGDIEMDDKLQDSRKVVIKVAPLKNGNGLWDAQKLRDVLLSKGSVLLRLHISNDSIEICEVVGNNKSDEAVDFTGIMIEVKDEEQDQILGLATLDPDGDTYDPLALGAVHSVEQASPPHYTRTYPSHPRGRSTALQPAMSRPGYKHLQSPPHYYMKNEVLGLPQPLEFEEPQFGASDWSGKEYYAGLLIQRKPPSSQYPALTPAPPPPPLLPPPRGRKRGRPPLSSRRGYSPHGGTSRSSPSKARSPNKQRLPEPIRFRPPTPPQSLLTSSLFRLNKSLNLGNKQDKRMLRTVGELFKREGAFGDGKKGAGKKNERTVEEESDITVTVTQPHFTNDDEESNDIDTSLKRFLIKLPCQFCDLVFRKRASLNAHIKHKHRGMQICPICKDKVKAKGKYGIKFHILKNHKDHPNFHCIKCGETFKLRHHLMNHERLQHEYLDSDDDDDDDDDDDECGDDNGANNRQKAEERQVEDVEAEARVTEEELRKRELKKIEIEKFLKEEEEKREREAIEKKKIEMEKKDRERREREKREREKREREKKEREREENMRREKEEKDRKERDYQEKKAREEKAKRVREEEIRNKKAKEEELKKKYERERLKENEIKLGKMGRNISKQAPEKDNVKRTIKSKTIVSAISVSNIIDSRNTRPISRGKIMNVKPPVENDPKNTSSGPRTRVTRSMAQVDMESETETKSDSDSDDDDEDEDDISVSSSESVNEEENYVCDICDIVFSQLTKLKDHKRMKHSRATRSQAAAKIQIKKSEDDEEEEDEEEEDEDEDEDDDDEEEEEEEDSEDEEDLLQKERERKEKEQREREESLTCPTCNKKCRSEYQLKLHMPVHASTKKRQLMKKSAANSAIANLPTKMKDEVKDVRQERSVTRASKRSVGVRVLRSSPQTKTEGGKVENSGPAKRRGRFESLKNELKNLIIDTKESVPKGKRVSQPSPQLLPSSSSSSSSPFLSPSSSPPPPSPPPSPSPPTSKDKKAKGDRPSYLLKVGSLFRCTKCNITFNREKSMTYHMKKIHETLYPFRGCEHCGKIFRSCGPYNRHLLEHRVYRCPEANCKAKYRKMLRLKQHQKNAHVNKPYRCSKCVAIFCKEPELIRHQDAKHPRVPSDDEEGSQDEDDDDFEEEERQETGNEKAQNQKREREALSDSEEPPSPSKRKARCVPVSYKEPEDDDDIAPVKKRVILGASPDQKNNVDTKDLRKSSTSTRASSNVNDKVHMSLVDVGKKTKMNNVLNKKTISQVTKKASKDEQKPKKTPKKVEKATPRTKTTSAKDNSHQNNEETPSSKQKDKLKDKKKSPKKKPAREKQHKVTLSWTAALRAQIQATKSATAAKNSPKQKKTKNTSVENVPSKAKRRSSNGSVSHNSTQSFDFASSYPSLTQSHDPLPCPGYLVGDDSMFSLDDNSQMDIIGDYYSAQYPPSEEISDFVPDDDESGPGKIIGLASPTVASPEPQHPPPLLSTSARPHIKPKVKKSQSRVIKMKKVCEQCGKAFNKSHKYMQHLRIHRPVLQCDKCNFKTKDVKKFRNHDISHKKKNPEVRCNFCNELFATAVTKMIHKKKIHNLYECKHCSVDWNTEDQLMDHLRDEHGLLDKKRKGYIHREEIVDVKPINIFLDPPPPTCDKELVCRLCNKETRNKYQLKIHIGQHLGVPSSKISDEFLLTQDVEKFEFDTQLPSTSQGMQELTFEMKGKIKSEPVDEVEQPGQLPVSEDSNSSRSTTPGGIPSAKDSSQLLHQSKHSSSLAYSANDSEHDSDEYFNSFMEESDNVNPAEKFFKCLFCNLCFSNPKYLKIHLVTVHTRQNPSSPPKRRRQMVACDTCGKEFRSQKVMRKHQKAKHRKTFSCPECNVSHFNIYRLLRHQKISHKNKLRCRYQCTALFDTEEECNDHYRYFHNKETTNLSCPYCGMEYKYEGFLINHLDICKDCPPDRRPVHVCGNCDAVLPNQKDYTIHVRTCKVWKPKQEVKKTPDSQTLSSGPLRVRDIGGEAGGKCVRPVITSRVKKEKLGNDCTTHENGDSDSSASTIRGNVTEAQNSRKQSHFIKGSSFQEGPQKCIYCPDRFESRIEAINHILAMHKNLITRMVTEPQLCSVCGMVFKNPLCLCKHISKHFCDLGMWDSLVPRNILNIVKTESFCWVCNCKLRGKLRHHLTLRNDTIDRALSVNCKEPDETTPFQCFKCNDSFLNRSSFWDHVKLHLTRLPKHSKQGEQSSLEDSIDNSVVSECSECLLKFTDREELYTHLASHFIEPYVEDPDSPEWKPYAPGRIERQGDGEVDTDEL